MKLSEMKLSELKDVVTIIGVIIGAVSLVVAACNLRLNRKTNRAKFWLELRSAFSKHDAVHRKLRPGGEWTDGKGPVSPEEFAQIEAYMGLFEHCEIMLEQKLIDQSTFEEIYAYRLKNLMSSDFVRIEKIKKENESWTRFIDLLKRMKIDYHC